MTLRHGRGSIAGMQTVPNEFSLSLAIKPFRDMFRFGGRSTRTELLSFWMLYVATIFVFVAITFIGLDVDGPIGRPVLAAFAIAFWLPAPALVSRRLHDAGWLGWPGAILVAVYGIVANLGMAIDPTYLLPLAIRIIINLTALALLVASLWQDTPGTNRYGLNPRLDPVPEPLESP